MRALATCFFLGRALLAYSLQLNVASSGGNASSPIQYGLIFEDISHSGDGGIYAELVQNRAFQAVAFENATVDPWVPLNGAKLTLQNTTALSKALPFSINVANPSKHGGKVGISNPGWWGISVAPQTYKGSFYVRGNYNGMIEASLRSDTTSEVFAKTSMHAVSTSKKWTQFKYTLVPKHAAKDVNNSLVITYQSEKATDGSLSFNLLSLFPPTYNNRPNGMRPDLMEALKAIVPKFLRFPGGNNLEGNGLAEDSPRWNWRNTIGPLRDRPGRLGTWSYYNTDGLGLNEYMEWCEDLQMEPLLAVWSGHYLDGVSISEDRIGVYVQDALNELEYLMGSTDTKYGALRASHGHPKPWKVKYVEIGNEDNLSNGFASYQSYRFQKFYDAISAAYPDIIIIASTVAIPIPAGAGGDYHVYTTPDSLVAQFSMFDNNSTSTYTLAGEYSAQTPNGGASAAIAPFWIGSVAESIYNIGLERNTGKVLGSTYAPILQNLNDYQWTPDLVSFTADPGATVRSTSVSTLGLLAGTLVTETRAVSSAASPGPVYWVAGYNADTATHVLKAAVYNSTDGADVPVRVKFEGVKRGAKAQLTVLTAADPYASAVVGGDNPVETQTTALVAGKTGAFAFKLPDLSVAVLKTV